MSIAADFVLPAGKIIVLGDSRPPDYFEFFLEDSRAMPALIFQAVAAERPVGVVHCGDIAVFGAARSFWQGWTAFDRDVSALAAANIPIYPVIGNHEYRGYTRTPLRHYFARFAHLNGKQHYSLRSGRTLFLFLDSNFARLGRQREQEQDDWLRRLLADASVDEEILHVIPIVHHPPFTNISRRYLVFEAKRVQQRWVPLFAAARKVSLIFSGHVHAYEHILEQGKHFIVSGGGGSPRFLLRPLHRRRRRDLWPGPELIRPFHYIRLVDPSARELLVEVVCLRDGRWTVGESFTVE